jgi:heme-degrading monooxygenase HmoA
MLGPGGQLLHHPPSDRRVAFKQPSVKLSIARHPGTLRPGPRGYGLRMLVKWITCRAADRAAFGLGQQAWAGLHGVPGFLGQAGGWSHTTADTAQIFGFWSDPTNYQTFMDRTHDRIAAAQTGTFEELRVRVFNHRLDIGTGVPLDFSPVSLLRIAHCQVRPGRPTDFVRVQADLGNPGLAAAPGMRGGVFAQRGDSEFLVLTAWRTAEDHQRYRDESFGSPHATAQPATDLVAVEHRWTVPG